MGKLITVIGYGSLLSEESAKNTAPNLKNFRIITVNGYKRIFNKVGIVFFETDNLSHTDVNVSSCATRKDSNTSIICSAFECDEDDFLLLYEREHRFKWIEVSFIDRDGEKNIGRMCTEYNDTDYKINKCITESNYQKRVSQFYPGKIWRNDIFPYPKYLNLCLQAAKNNGDDVYKNFLETSFLADGETSIADYLSTDLLDPNTVLQQEFDE